MKRLAKWGATPLATKTKAAAATSSGAGSPTEQPLEGKGEREREREGEGGGEGRERGTPSYRRSRLRSDGSVKSCRSTGSAGTGCSGSSLAVGGDGGITGGGLHSYKQLEHLPCVVVLAGSSRAGLSFPRYIHVYKQTKRS